jgi:acetoin utilization deacetylase AcuC-like enzyme
MAQPRYTSRVILFSHTACNGHKPLVGHPECPERLDSVVQAIGVGREGWKWQEPRKATHEELLSVHTSGHVDRVWSAHDDAPLNLDADTYMSEGSLRAALLAAGAARDAARSALAGKPAAALIRPPGHHATRDRAMGFCLFNNVALAAKQAKRVLIIDWDVHHGNGTQDIFYEDPDVLYFSTHRWPFYPGTGARSETGSGRGLGFTINRPFPWNTGASTFKAEFAEVIEGPCRKFDPELVLISAGFDAWKNDPIGGLNLEVADFAELTEIVKKLKRPIASVLEGGYDLEALPRCVLAHLESLDRA